MKYSRQEEVRFRHADFAGIVFYPRFLEMLNDLVEDWFAEALGRPFSKIHERQEGIPTVDLKVQFKKAARIGDVLQKSLWVTKLGGASVTFAFEFLHADGSTCLEGEATLVNVALDKENDTIKPQPFDQSTLEKILQYQS